MATTWPRFVTKDMIPEVWRFAEEQENEWLVRVAGHMPGETPRSLQRIFAVELPGFPISYAYQEAYRAASVDRDDLVMPLITSREQWSDRPAAAAGVIRCLLEGIPPTVAFCAIAVQAHLSGT